MLWAIFKKKPIVTKTSIHGPNCWITAIATLRNTDLIATGTKLELKPFILICKNL